MTAPCVLYRGDRGHNNLEYSLNLDAVPRRGNPEIAATVREVVAGLAPGPKDRQESLAILLANLFLAWRTPGNPFLAVPLGKADYGPKSRLRSLRMTYPGIRWAVEQLHTSGFIERHRGYHADGTGRRTRIRAMDALIEGFLRNRLELHCVEMPKRHTVELRGPKIEGRPGRPINISRGRLASQAKPFANNLGPINEALSAASVELHILEETFIEYFVNRAPNRLKPLIPPSPLAVRLHRIFNLSFDLGGRFYGHWSQNIPCELRRHIRINGESVMELDYKSLHPTLLYREKGLTLPSGDLYMPPGWPKECRPILKRLLLCGINADNPAEACSAVRRELSQDASLLKDFHECTRNVWLAPAFEALQRLHQPIADQLGSGAGLRLQRF